MAYKKSSLGSYGRTAEREQVAEGEIWPVAGVLLISVLLSTTISWLLLGWGTTNNGTLFSKRDMISRSLVDKTPVISIITQRQQLLSRLRALQVNRSWFLQLVDTSMLTRFPDRNGRLLNSSAEDASLRHIWNELAQEWLARIEQLSPKLRSKLGRLNMTDWQTQRQELVDVGVSIPVIEQLISISIQSRFMPSATLGHKTLEPYRQLWYAAALQRLEDIRIRSVIAWAAEPAVLSAWVPAYGTRLITIQVPSKSHLVLSAKATPMVEMIVFGSGGGVIINRGLLIAAEINPGAGSPVQVVVSNKGMASSLVTLTYHTRLAPAVLIARPEQLPSEVLAY